MDGFGDFAFPDPGTFGAEQFAQSISAPEIFSPSYDFSSWMPPANNFGFNLSSSFDPSAIKAPSVSGAGQMGSQLFEAPPLPEATVAPPGTSGSGNSSPFGDFVKQYAQPVASILGAGSALAQIPLGLKALDIARQGQQAQQSGIQQTQQAATTAKEATAPALTATQTLLPAGTKAIMGGGLPDVLQANVDQQVNEARQQMLNNLLRSGMSAETANAMIAGQLEQLRMQLTLQAANALLSSGESTSTIAVSGAQAQSLAGGMGGQLGSSEFQLSTNALTNAQQALQRLLGQSA